MTCIAEGTKDLSAFDCVDCKVSTINEYYMVKDDVWLQSGIKLDGGSLCISCLENRIGRALNHNDFIDAPINVIKWNKMSEKLMERLRT
jgi:hypothetical protein